MVSQSEFLDQWNPGQTRPIQANDNSGKFTAKHPENVFFIGWHKINKQVAYMNTAFWVRVIEIQAGGREGNSL
jgi:hypothetical protein